MRSVKIKVEFWQGFWWWFDVSRADWFVGPSPVLGVPLWAPVNAIPDRKRLTNAR